MSFDAHANFGYTTVTAAPAPAASGTSITVSDASVFPAAPFNATVWATGEIPVASNAEIVRVTAIVGNVLTITRAQELSVARSILVGDQIANTITAKVVTDIEAAIPSTAGLLSAVNVSAGATSANLSAFTFSNSNGVSFGLTNGIITGTVATNYQSQGAYLTTAALSQDSSKYAGTNGAITGGSLTVNTSGVSINLPAYLTTAMQSNAVTLSNAKFSGGTLSALRSDLTFGDSNGISFGLNTNGVLTGTVATNYQSAGAYLTTAALSQDSSKYAGTNGAMTGGSITVNTSGVSVNLPAYLSTQSTQYLAVTLGGNTAGTTTFNASNNATIFLHGGNNITLSGNGSSITISGPNAGGAQTGISGIVVSDTTYTSGTVSFSNAGNITIASSVNGATQYIKLSGNAAQTTQSAIKAFGVSNTGQTAGNTGVSTGIDWVLAGSNSITLSQSTAGGGPNTVWIQHPAWLTTAMLSNAVTLSNIKISAGANSANLSAVTFSDSNGLAFGLNAGTITGSYTVPTVTNSAMTVSDAATSGTLARLAFTNLNGVTLSLSTGAGGSHTIVGSHNAITSQSTQFIALTLGGNTAGTTTFHATNNASLFLNGGNNITLSGNGSTVTISAAAQTNQSAIKGFGVSNTGQTAGNTGISTGIDWVLAGSNSITLSQSTAGGGPNTVWIQHPAWLTTAMASNRGSDFVAATAGFNGTNASGTMASNSWSVSVAAQTAQTMSWYAVGNTTGQSSNTSFDARTVSFNGAGNVSVGYSAGSVVISGGTAAPSPVNFSAGTTSGNLGSVVFSNSNGVSFGLNGSTVTATVSTYDTVGTATTVYSVASANSVGTVTRWAAEDHRHAGVGGFGISTSGNTSGTTGSNVGTVWLQGGNSITLSQITSNNGSHTIVVSGAKDGFNGWLEPYPLNTATATLLPAAGSWYLAPFTAFGSVSGGRVNFLAVNTGTANLFQDLGETAYKSNTTGTLSQVFTLSAAMAIFSQGTGANSTRLESVWSNSHSFGWSKVLNVSTNAATNIAVSLAHSLSYQSEIGSDGAYTNVQYANAGSSTFGNSSGASTGLSTVFSSGRNIISGSLVQPFGFSTTLTAGVYWMGYAWSTTRGTTTTGGQLGSAPDFGFSGLLGMSRLAVDSIYRNFGSTVTTARSQLIPYGVYTGAANMAPPSAIALSSDLSSLASQWVPYFAFNNRGLTK